MAATVAVLYTEFPKLELEHAVLRETGAELVMVRDPNSVEGQAVLAETDILMVTTQRVTAKMIQQMRRCRLISRVGTGLDSIDISFATERGVWVTNVPDYGVDEVSTHTIAMLLAHARGLYIAFEQAERQVWDQTTVRPLRRLAGQTLGIVGFGRIARAVAAKGLGLNLRVLAYDPYVPAEAIQAAGCISVDTETLFTESDYITLHSPLTSETQHMINADALAKMKPTAFLINAARGPLIDQTALFDAVSTGKLAGAALDVFATEPLPADSPLWKHPRIWITPHVAWYSEQAKVDVRVRGAEEALRVLTGQPPKNPVNKL
ncbi:MAG: C-terminal binding protein [Anaerolineae bacterium]|nr:C-terminal binding protein [Anaerolineae bacterium]